jgi:hypothetical protein
MTLTKRGYIVAGKRRYIVWRTGFGKGYRPLTKRLSNE